ncbi:esterase/lipase family protein [Piscinibacter sp.]|uniref:esterase/lipase family protein n=1 Tax=Piscinibacter sp. TaxID=1903157 RepID=UPI0039E342EE
MPDTPSPGADLRGAARLAADATAGLADLVEAMHERIARLPGSGAALDGRTGGITGLVYKTIRGVTRVAGGSVDALLGVIAPALGRYGDGAERDAIVAALNGVLGDYLAASGNPLVQAMQLRCAAVPGPRALVLLHGLCMNDRQWLRNGHDHGAALARDLGWTPIYLRYNSGLPIAANGLAFAQRLETLLAEWPVPLQRLAIIGHSMGGLVARSAVDAAMRAGMAWPKRLDDLVFLGTPHHGAPLERAGHWVETVLGATPYATPFARLGRVRSAGITDLRHGLSGLPLPEGVRCCAAAACLGAPGRALKEKLLGDGLVPLDSALGRHAEAALTLAFAPDRQWTAYGTGHLELLSSAEVYAQLETWLG